MAGRTYMAIDLKSFYASVECRERGLDPLTANLVVADRSRTEKTICLAVSPSMKALGLPGRCRLFEVEAKIRDIKKRTGDEIEYITAVPRMALYMKYSADIFNVYMKYVSPEDIHVYSIDEVFMDVTDYMKLYRISAHELARRMIRDVLDTTGITATAGIAPNLYLCKVAMDIVAKHVKADKDGVRIAELDEMGYRRLLWDHRPLTDFWRIGRGTAKKLESNGMYTMGDVARMSLYQEDWFFKTFGIDAEILLDHAWGRETCTIKDIKAYKPKASSLGSAQVLQYPYDKAKARIVVREMAESLALDLVEKNLVTSGIVLVVNYDRTSDTADYDGEMSEDRYGRMAAKPANGVAKLRNASSSTEKITNAVLELYDRIVNPNLLVRRIGMSAVNVEEEAFQQIDLFTDVEKEEKEKKMQQAMLDIKKKFGKNAILKATSLQEGATTRERNQQIGGHKA